mgnify:FL=1
MKFNHHIVIFDGWERAATLKHQVIKSSGAFRDPRVSGLREEHFKYIKTRCGLV